MEDQTLEPKTNEASYSVILFPGKDLPTQYEALVFSKWKRSLKYSNDYFKLIDDQSYYTHYHRYLEMIIAKAMIRLAVLSDDFDIVLGFSCVRDNVLDYVHVHKDYRRIGIGKSLVPNNIDTITHLTKIGLSIWAKQKDVVFDPFI